MSVLPHLGVPHAEQPATNDAEREQAMDLQDLKDELTWFTRILDGRFRSYFSAGDPPMAEDHVAIHALATDDVLPPEPTNASSSWARFLRERRLTRAERTAVVLALVPHLRPQLLDVFFTRNATFDRRFTEFGGVLTDEHFEPTGETLAFILGGDSLEARVDVARMLDPAHPLMVDSVLECASLRPDQPRMKAPLRITPEYLTLFTQGEREKPVFSAEFPAQRLETGLGWEDLVLHPGTLRQLLEIKTFLTHGQVLLQDWGMAKRLRPGYRALFYGPPGTGKTISAALLGKLTHLEVYRIDLSLVVSKYIGETEKNLARVLNAVERGGMIVLFDECDALFSRRTEIKDSHDLHANQQIAYLLQRIETFEGVAILASNLRENLDEAFNRRFESVIYFPLPRFEERLRLWTEGLPKKAKLDADVDISAIAREHELSGGAIMNAIRYASLTALAEGGRPISRKDLLHGIRRELAK